MNLPMTGSISTELLMMVYSLGVLFLILAAQGVAGILSNGLAAQAGARDNLQAPSQFHSRVNRLRANMIENLLLFVPVVLVASYAGISNETTILGAQLFFYGRIAHTVFYMMGLPWVRPVAWAVALIGTFMVASQLPLM